MDTKALRQKILDLAIRGKLVPQDPNDEPASVLLERIRAQKQQMVREGKLKSKDLKDDTVIFVGEDNLHYEKFSDGTVKCIEDEISFEVPEGWAWCRVASVTSILTDGEHKTPHRCESFKGFYLLSARNIRDGFIALDDVDYVDEQEFERISARCNPKRNDVLISCSGTVGRITVVADENHYVMVRSAAMLRLCEIDPCFVMYVLQSGFLQGQMQSLSKQTAQANLFQGAIASLLIPIPPLKEQLCISTKVKKLSNYIDEIETSRNDVASSVSLIKAHILDLAIRGKLVPQNPDDEPASVLLDSIRIEKEELVKQGKIKQDKRESVIYRGEDNSYYEHIDSETFDITEEIPFSLPDSWRWVRISQLFEINPRNRLGDDMEVSFIPMPLIEDGFSGKHGSEIRKWKEVKSGFTHFAEGDIGIAKITPCFENRKSVIFQNLHNGYGAGTTELHVLRPLANCVNAEYALAFFKTEAFIQNGVQEFTGAVGQQRIGKDYITETLFPLPPYKEQERIENRIKAIFTLINQIETSLA